MREHISTLVLAALPPLVPQTRRIVEELIARRGYPGAAAMFAASVGMRNRFQLARLLRRVGLPSLEVLAGWIKVLTWVVEWETGEIALCRTALEAARDPAVCYRRVEAVTGLPWSRLRHLGSGWVVMRMAEVCRESREERGNGGSPPHRRSAGVANRRLLALRRPP
jgi:hypothetical protein